MKAAYRVLAILVQAGVVVQLALIAFGAFTTAHDAEDGVAVDGAYSNTGLDLHAIVGMAIGLVALLLLIASFFTKIERGKTLAAAVVGLVVVQFVLATVSFGVPVLGILHGLNAMAIAGVGGIAARNAGRPAETPAKTTVAAGA
jgi:hypothetical protein